ncbi:hypothetical protein AKJ09_01111 [Labilithrix luteola]|uniref:Uncharacterized protein n=1 Tax=Labilithrix luteola TaxID=1391654 RepID=A0A0K1PLQ0_9BACT|nr:hypothetical protein AKJ09_01111 [Labilithrix luteola]
MRSLQRDGVPVQPPDQEQPVSRLQSDSELTLHQCGSGRHWLLSKSNTHCARTEQTIGSNVEHPVAAPEHIGVAQLQPRWALHSLLVPMAAQATAVPLQTCVDGAPESSVDGSPPPRRSSPDRSDRLDCSDSRHFLGRSGRSRRWSMQTRTPATARPASTPPCRSRSPPRRARRTLPSRGRADRRPKARGDSWPLASNLLRAGDVIGDVFARRGRSRAPAEERASRSALALRARGAHAIARGGLAGGGREVGRAACGGLAGDIGFDARAVEREPANGRAPGAARLPQARGLVLESLARGDGALAAAGIVGPAAGVLAGVFAGPAIFRSGAFAAVGRSSASRFLTGLVRRWIVGAGILTAVRSSFTSMRRGVPAIEVGADEVSAARDRHRRQRAREDPRPKATLGWRRAANGHDLRGKDAACARLSRTISKLRRVRGSLASLDRQRQPSPLET